MSLNSVIASEAKQSRCDNSANLSASSLAPSRDGGESHRSCGGISLIRATCAAMSWRPYDK